MCRDICFRRKAQKLAANIGLYVTGQKCCQACETSIQWSKLAEIGGAIIGDI